MPNPEYACYSLIVELNKERDIKLLKLLGMKNTNLTPSQRDNLVKMVLQYQDVFALDKDELGTTSVTQHVI